jgi:hypothetical protein
VPTTTVSGRFEKEASPAMWSPCAWVCDDQLVAGVRMGGQPVGDELIDRVAERSVVRDRTGVEQEGAVVTEEEEDEGRLERRVLALPQDDRVVAIAVDLPGRIRGMPAGW